jgi:V/A-type H+-transporting ATPase subunit I
VFAGHIPQDTDVSSLSSNEKIDFIINGENVVVFCANDISSDIEKDLLNIGFRSMDVPDGEGLPKVMLNSLDSQHLKLENEKEAILHEIQALATRNGDWLVACEEHYAALSEKSGLPLKLATSENMFVLDGWVPSNSVSDLQQSFQGLDVYYEVDNDSKEEPPIKLDNPEVAKPFELFTKLYSTPKHWEFDPTMIIFITYPLFFGLMVGDAGYGFAYILFGHYILTKFSHTEALANLGRILRTAGIYTFLFGTFIYAEAFGQSFYYIGKAIGFNSGLFANHYGPGFDIPLIEKAEGFSWHLPIHKFDPHGAQLMLLSSIIIGAIHISLGLILGFLNEWKHHDLKHAIYAKLSFFMILWGGLLALVSVVGLLPESVQTIGLVVMLTGLGLAIIGEGVVGLLEFPTIFSNVISYARIGAIGLSDYGLAYTVNFISFSLLWPSGPAGMFVAVIVMLFGHLTVFTLGIIGTGINSLRLQYVEFFTKFVQGGGTLYSPFGYIRKYTKEKEVIP